MELLKLWMFELIMKILKIQIRMVRRTLVLLGFKVHNFEILEKALHGINAEVKLL